MLGSITIQLRDGDNVKVFPSNDGGPELLAASNDFFVLLRDVSWVDMQALAHKYAEEHDAAMVEYFLQPVSNVRGPDAPKSCERTAISLASESSPEAFRVQASSSTTAGYVRVATGMHISHFLLKEELTKRGLHDAYVKRPKTVMPVAWQLVHETYETQREIAKAIVAPTMRTMEWAKPGSKLDSVASVRVLELCKAATSTMGFLNRALEPLQEWIRDPDRKNIKGANSDGVRRPYSLAWFAIWLVERGILLFPRNVYRRAIEFFPLRYSYFRDGWIRPVEAREKCKALVLHVVNTVRPTEGGNDERICRRSAERDGWNSAQALFLIAPCLRDGRTSAELIQNLRHLVSSIGVRNHEYFLTGIWKLETVRLKASGIAPSELLEMTALVVDRTNYRDRLWSWVDDPEHKPAGPQRYFRSDFTAGPNLILHLAELRILFPSIAGNSAVKVSGAISVWLYFLAHLPDGSIPTTMLDVRPKLIDSIVDCEEMSFRRFMVEQKVSLSYQGQALSSIKRAWAVANARNSVDGDEQLVCPIVDQINVLNSKRNERRRWTSARRAIDMDILEILIEENRANDFEFSRERRHGLSGPRIDARQVIDPKSQALVSEFWPGIAVLMDLLLQIPLRHKQGRYLDSGEGDEFILDPESLQLAPNALSTATKGRNQAFMQRVSLSPVRNEPGLGMFINTNKTGTDYPFPWLATDIAANIQRLIDWQKHYNPIHGPVSDRESGLAEKNAQTEPVWVYPIFRDPASHAHRAVSSETVLKYFRDLMKLCEAKYNLASCNSVRFFDNDGDPIYDIHALRVTGVTRLLTLGVDPRIVRMLVGHASLTMTFYYEHVSFQRIANAVNAGLEKRRPTREMLMNMSDDERRLYLEKLFNMTEQPSLSFDLLRTGMDARSPIIDVMFDGICPGMSCTEAGAWRPRACSRCRWRSTGTPFLPGLVLSLNNLMAEMIQKQGAVAEMRSQLQQKRQAKESILSLEAEIDRAEKFLDNLIQDWYAEHQYVLRAEGGLGELLANLDAESQEGSDFDAPYQLMLLSEMPERLSLAMHECHHLALFTNLIEGAKTVQGFIPLPAVREKRDEMLLEIARHANKTELFYRLPKGVRRLALDQFANFLLEHDSSVDGVKSLIDGATSLDSLPNAAERLNEILRPAMREMRALKDDGSEP